MVSCDGQDKYTAPVCDFCFVNIERKASFRRCFPDLSAVQTDEETQTLSITSGSAKAAGKVTAEDLSCSKEQQ